MWTKGISSQVCVPMNNWVIPGTEVRVVTGYRGYPVRGMIRYWRVPGKMGDRVPGGGLPGKRDDQVPVRGSRVRVVTGY